MNAFLTAILALGFAAATGVARADGIVLQDSCRTDGDRPTVYFSIVNTPGSAPVCGMTLFPDEASCLLVDCGAGTRWTCAPGNVTTFWYADPVPAACVESGETLSGFSFAVLAEGCCLTATFFAADNMHSGSQKVCVDCTTVDVRREMWGQVKQLYE